MSRFVNLVGKKFGRLDVTENLGVYYRGKQRDILWRCRCTCGEIADVSGNALKTSHTQSCGCLLQEWRNKKKGVQKPGVPERSVYGMYRYNAKKRQLDFKLTFENFLFLAKQDCSYCGTAPSNRQVSGTGEIFFYNGIDRIDNNGGYIEGNCVSCCDWCNTAKMNHSVATFIEKCRKISKRWMFEQFSSSGKQINDIRNDY